MSSSRARSGQGGSVLALSVAAARPTGGRAQQQNPQQTGGSVRALSVAAARPTGGRDVLSQRLVSISGGSVVDGGVWTRRIYVGRSSGEKNSDSGRAHSFP